HDLVKLIAARYKEDIASKTETDMPALAVRD
ncbi:MAG: hypothetical protein ACI88G_001799, partial [Woeseiaceae bacterium]